MNAPKGWDVALHESPDGYVRVIGAWETEDGSVMGWRALEVVGKSGVYTRGSGRMLTVDGHTVTLWDDDE